MQVTFLGHSGFCLELENIVLIFDWWQGELPPLPTGKPLAVFASHSHQDHFKPEIFALDDGTRSVRFLLGNDIKLSRRHKETDVYISFESFSAEDVDVKLNEALAKAYADKLKLLQEEFGILGGDILELIAKFPDVITVEKAQTEESVIWQALEPALEEAIAQFVSMRTAEGENLKKDILLKAERIKALVAEVKERSPLVVVEYRDKLNNRLKDLLGGVEADPQRVAAEVAIFADRGCVDEEVTRLESHLVQLGDILEAGGQMGRKLDFLVQEMNRES